MGVLSFQYNALSAMISTESEQSLYLIGEQQRADVYAELLLPNPMVFREALSAILFHIRRGFDYRPSDEAAENVEAANALEILKGNLPNLSPIAARQQLHAYMEQWDPNAWVIPDATVSIQPTGVTLEVFNKKGGVYHRLFVPASAYTLQGEPCFGTTNVEIGMDLYRSLQLVTNNQPLRIMIGAKAAQSVSEQYRGALHKKQNIPQWWFRTYLQLMGYATQEAREFSMARMDLYNILRYLRLHKEQDDEVKRSGRATLFALAPGKTPEVILQPWNHSFVCTGSVYKGQKAEVVSTWDRKELWTFERLLPFVENVSAQLLGKAQPGFWSIDCGSVEYTLGTVGFSALNWAKGIEMDLLLPRYTANDPAHDQVLAELSSTYQATVEELANKLSLPQERVKFILCRACQNGQAFWNAAQRCYHRRQLMGAELDEEQLRYRDEQEQDAYQLAGSSPQEVAAELGIATDRFAWAYTKARRALSHFQSVTQTSFAGICAIQSEIDALFGGLSEDVGLPLFQIYAFYQRCYTRGMELRQVLDNKLSETDTLALYGQAHLDAKAFRKHANVEKKLAAELQERIHSDIHEMLKEVGISKDHANQLLAVGVVTLAAEKVHISQAAAIVRAAEDALHNLQKVSGVDEVAAVLTSEQPDRDALAQQLGCSSQQISLLLALNHSGRVRKNIHYRPTGELDFVDCEVSEPKNEHQENDPIYHPAFEWSAQKGVRKASCTCAFWKKQSSGTKQPCAHLKGLWLTHVRDLVAEDIACEYDSSLIEADSCRYVKRHQGEAEEEQMELKRKRLILQWGQAAKLRRQVLVFGSTTAARKDYLSRKKQLERKGFLNASGA